MENMVKLMWAKSVMESRLFDLRHAQEELRFIPACWRGDKAAIRRYKAVRMADVLDKAKRYEEAKAAYLAAL